MTQLRKIIHRPRWELCHVGTIFVFTQQHIIYSHQNEPNRERGWFLEWTVPLRPIYLVWTLSSLCEGWGYPNVWNMILCGCIPTQTDRKNTKEGEERSGVEWGHQMCKSANRRRHDDLEVWAKAEGERDTNQTFNPLSWMPILLEIYSSYYSLCSC